MGLLTKSVFPIKNKGSDVIRLSGPLIRTSVLEH